MNSCATIIRLCRHTFSDGRHCHGPAVRGRACCRHHLGARTRLHTMARARRLASVPQLRVPMTPRDLALNRAEVLRVVTAGAVDFATARMMLWAMDLAAAALPAKRASRPHGSRNPNVSYYVPVNPLFSESCTKKPSQVPENTRGQRRGYHRTLPLETQPEFFQQPLSPCSESRVTSMQEKLRPATIARRELVH